MVMERVLPFVFLGILTWFGSGAVWLQGVTVGSNNPPDPSAVLDVQSSQQGILIPRMNTAQRNAIPNPAIGLQVYNTDTDCLEMYFSSGGWKPVQCGCNAFPNATFNVPAASINNPVTLTAPQPNMTYSWIFQGGSPGTASAQTVQVTWGVAGTYGVTLTATDSAQCTSTYTDSITVVPCQAFTHTFTNCGQTGRTGPSQTQCDNTYGAGFVNVNGGIQEWTVPETGVYSIEVAGAQGGHAFGQNGGNGAILRGHFNLSQGEVIKILVGQQGEYISPLVNGLDGQNSGGGGGTFVFRNVGDAFPLIAAGGGGGASLGGTNNRIHATTTTSGNAGTNKNFSTAGSAGGTNGNAGSYGTYSQKAGSGAGWNTGGNVSAHTQCSYTVQHGAGPSGGGQGGLGGGGNSSSNGNNRAGGFGGGGGASGACNTSGSGGGGGYSGGGVGNDCCTSVGGGGGSYINPAATNVATSNGQYNGSSSLNGAIQNIGSFNSGHGYVTITRICP